MADEFVNALAARCSDDTAAFAVTKLEELALRFKWTPEQVIVVAQAIGDIIGETTRNCGRLALEVTQDTLK